MLGGGGGGGGLSMAIVAMATCTVCSPWGRGGHAAPPTKSFETQEVLIIIIKQLYTVDFLFPVLAKQTSLCGWAGSNFVLPLC